MHLPFLWVYGGNEGIMKSHSEDTLECKQVVHIHSEREKPFKQKHCGYAAVTPQAGIFAANNGEQKSLRRKENELGCKVAIQGHNSNL